jgi:hypothetical protein
MEAAGKNYPSVRQRGHMRDISRSGICRLRSGAGAENPMAEHCPAFEAELFQVMR